MALQRVLVTEKIRALLPRVVERREIIRTVPQCWREAYTDDSQKLIHQFAGDIRKALEALDLETATVEDVEKIIGNSSWTRLECNCCEQDVERVVSIPREYETPIAICGDCAAGVVEILGASS